MKKIAIAIISMVFFSVPAIAEDITSAFIKCATTKENMTRLACYDKIRDDVIRANSPAAEVAKSSPPSLGRSYEQLMTGMGEYFPEMEASRLASGELRRMGKSDQSKAMAMYEIVGDKGLPASRASLNFFAVGDQIKEGAFQAQILNLGGMAVVSLFVKNVFPGWHEGPKAVMDALLTLPKKKVKSGAPIESKLNYDNKTIELRFLKAIGMFTVAIEPAAR